MTFGEESGREKAEKWPLAVHSTGTPSQGLQVNACPGILLLFFSPVPMGRQGSEPASEPSPHWRGKERDRASCIQASQDSRAFPFSGFMWGRGLPNQRLLGNSHDGAGREP